LTLTLTLTLTYMQIKYTSRGPCLVEVGSRCHGGEGTWQPIAQECMGYTQVWVRIRVGSWA
ncbi:unnamed protein product, partial [Discosporangium mesarthrocarpum]